MCELRTFAKIVELHKVKSFFFAEGNEENWLQKCLISYSPARDILAIAYCNKMIVLEPKKWSNVPEDEVKIAYHIVWQGIPDKCEKELIKSILCLPISTSTSRKRSEVQTTPDWTCIVVGFTSGYIRFYTEMGSLLLSQQLHDEPVTDIMTQSSLLSQYHSKAEKNEDVHILYRSVICSVIGFVLLNTLNACRNQLARVQANLGTTSLTLTYKKWAFSSQEAVRGCAVAGPVPVNMFDHLFTASICGGFNAKYQNNPPHSQLFVAVGCKPFIGFHYAFDNEPQPILSELTKAVATKLKSAVPGWLLGGIKPTIRPIENRMEPAEEMGNRFRLTDDKRIGNSILMSPLGDIAAVNDNFGRISIIDMSYGIAVRMLKGYRDSHCGWVLVEELSDTNNAKRRVEFLIIYVPKKGLIEIWTMQFGAKVVSFNVDKNGRLLNSNFGIIGLYDGQNFHNSCTYIESNGEMKEFNIPFYCCLSTKNNDRVRDVHMLKNMMKILKEESDQQDKIVQESINLAQHLKTPEIIKQAVDSLSSSKYVSANVLSAFLSALKDRLTSETDLFDDEDDFYENMECLEHLTKLFQFLYDMFQLPPDYCSVVDDSEFINQQVCDILRIKENELDKLIALLPTSRNKQKKVTFSESNSMSRTRTFYAFLSCFEKETVIKLQQFIPNKILDKISDLVSGGVMHGKCEVDEWARVCEDCRINEADLLFLVFHYWLLKPLSITLEREMLNLYKIISAILESYGYEDARIDWQKIRHQLTNSDCPLTAITAAIVCRTVCADIHNYLMKVQTEENSCEKADPETDTNPCMDWETVTQEDCHWDILISQLEDITFLDSALKYQPNPLPATLYCVPYTPPNIVLSSILRHGKGAISEFVAKWLVGMGLDPEFLLQNDMNVTVNEKSSPKKSLLGVQEGIAPSIDPSFEARPMRSNEKDILDLLEKLIAIFPYSLSSNSLLANMFWEYLIAWKKSVNDLRPLEAALTSLQLIQCPYIKHGCCFLAWSTHLSATYESASRLVNKVGKLPKDRLCRQDTGIAEENFTQFLKLWTDFIDIFVEAVFDMEVTPKPIFKYEPLWDSNAFSPKNTTPPLTELAAKQKPSNQDLLYLLSQNARTLYFLTSFPLRITHPLETLFPSSIAEMLLLNVQSDEAFYHPNPDEKIIVNRGSFLKKLITAIINEVLKPYVEPNDSQASKSVDKLKPYVDWISKVFKLAHDWSFPVDALKRHQICELYAHGYDRIAEEIIPSVNEKQQLGHQMLAILGMRIKILLDSNVSYYSYFSPTVTTWISTLNERSSVATVPISDSVQLVLAINHLNLESGKDENLVNLLLDSLTVLNGSEER